MKTVTFTSTVAQTAETLNITTSENGRYTLSGTLVGATGTVRTRTGDVEAGSLFNSNRGITVNAILTEDMKRHLEQTVAEMISSRRSSNNTDPYVDITLEIRQFANPKPGVHPTTGQPTLNMIVNAVSIVEISDGEDIIDESLLSFASEGAAASRTFGRMNAQAGNNQKKKGIISAFLDALS